MIAEDYENDSVVRNNQTCWGYYWRDVMDRISKVCFRAVSTLVSRLVKRFKQRMTITTTVEPSMLEKSGVLGHGVMIEALMKVARKMMQHSGRSFDCRNWLIITYRLCRWMTWIRIDPNLYDEPDVQPGWI